jgi:hypothetical protein
MVDPPILAKDRSKIENGLCKKKNNGSILYRKCRIYIIIKRKTDGWGGFSMSNMYKQSYITLFITFELYFIVIVTHGLHVLL